MDITNDVSTRINKNNNIIEKDQNNFLESTLWNVINTGLDMGIRAILPNFLEDKVIEIKDTLLNSGLKKETKNAINSAIDIGKKTIQKVNRNLKNINQAEEVIKKGRLTENVSNIINNSVEKAVNNESINKDIGNTIKNNNDTIMEKIEKNINNSFKSQKETINEISDYTKSWKKFYKEKNFKGMEKEYKNIKKKLKETIPLENILKQAREVENIHLLIKNNGKNFDLSTEELQLSKKLVS